MPDFCHDCSGDDIDPCCQHSPCEAAESDKAEPCIGKLSNCIHCGGELEYWNGAWYHHEQMDLPEHERNEPQDY
jgi:hypothetical protein